MESIIIPENLKSRKEKYELLIPQIKSLVDGEPDLIANLANIIGALKQGLGFFWIGVYLVKEKEAFKSSNHQGELVLGPYQGPVACTRISFGKGVCGTSWKEKKAIVVKNVDEFPGHIACSADSKSEIVVPFFKNLMVAGVIDADSDNLNAFDETDAFYLKEIARLIETLL